MTDLAGLAHKGYDHCCASSSNSCDQPGRVHDSKLSLRKCLIYMSGYWPARLDVFIYHLHYTTNSIDACSYRQRYLPSPKLHGWKGCDCTNQATDLEQRYNIGSDIVWADGRQVEIMVEGGKNENSANDTIIVSEHPYWWNHNLAVSPSLIILFHEWVKMQSRGVNIPETCLCICS